MFFKRLKFAYSPFIYFWRRYAPSRYKIIRCKVTLILINNILFYVSASFEREGPKSLHIFMKRPIFSLWIAEGMLWILKATLHVTDRGGHIMDRLPLWIYCELQIVEAMLQSTPRLWMCLGGH